MAARAPGDVAPGKRRVVTVTALPVVLTPTELVSDVASESSPSLSPDGRHVAYVSDLGGAPHVWVRPVGGDLALPVDTGPHPVPSGPRSPDSGWLACVLAPGGTPRTEVWLVRPDGAALRQLAGFGADAAFLPRWLPGRAGRAGPALLGVTEVTGSVSRALLVDPVGGS